MAFTYMTEGRDSSFRGPRRLLAHVGRWASLKSVAALAVAILTAALFIDGHMILGMWIVLCALAWAFIAGASLASEN
jgi:hypothetical protein